MTVEASREHSSYDQLWDRVVDRAVALNLRNGDQLPSVRELADEMDVKPGAVRDALLHAQAKGVVRVVPRVGAFLETNPAAARIAVSAIIPRVDSALRKGLGREPTNVLHVLDARRVIEVELIGHAAERRRVEDLLPVRQLLDALLQLPEKFSRQDYVELDLRYHEALAGLAGNDVLATMQRILADLLTSHFAQVPSKVELRPEAERSHIAIYSAVVAGDAPRARREMHEHLNKVSEYLLSFIQESPPSPGRKKHSSK